MKKRIYCFLLISTSFLISCHRPSYIFSRTSTPFGVELREGKWLLNEIDSPGDIEDNLTKIAIEGFSEFLGDNLFYIRNVNGLLIPKEIPLDPEVEDLKMLKIGTGFDFFINIKAESLQDDLGDLQIGSVEGQKKNVGEITLEIYDLNSLDIIYKQNVRGIISVKNDTQDFAFAKSANNLIIGGLKKIMKKIKKAQ